MLFTLILDTHIMQSLFHLRFSQKKQHFSLQQVLLSMTYLSKGILTFAIFAPLVILAWYIEFVHFSGYHLWNDWNFSQTAKDGSVMTMAYNLITLKLFNDICL